MTTDAHPAALPEPEEPAVASSGDAGRTLTGRQLMALAGIIGLAGGLAAAAYYALLFGAIAGLWRHAAGWLGGPVDLTRLELLPRWRPGLWVLTTVGGCGVGLCLRVLGRPGEIAAVVDNIHMKRGRLDTRQTWPMTAVSVASIASGGSAGPEAPLVQIIGSLGSWLGDRLRLHGDLVRTLTFCGMGAALGAFFGAPLGGALFALEIPHRRGLEYYEALVPTIFASLLAFFVFRVLVGYDGAIYHLPTLDHLTLAHVALGVVMGLIGAGVALVFVGLFRAVEVVARPWHDHPVWLATLGGAAIGGIAQVFPVTLFWSEYQIPQLLQGAGTLGQGLGLLVAAGVLGLLALAKMLAVGCTLHSGFRGGFIFPLFFIGAAAGLAVWLVTQAYPALPAVPLAVAVLSTMAAVNVAVTKTPISTAVIVTTLSGTNMLPVLVAASFVSFLATTRLSLIETQRSRAAVAPPAGG